MSLPLWGQKCNSPRYSGANRRYFYENQNALILLFNENSRKLGIYLNIQFYSHTHYQHAICLIKTITCLFEFYIRVPTRNCSEGLCVMESGNFWKQGDKVVSLKRLARAPTLNDYPHRYIVTLCADLTPKLTLRNRYFQRKWILKDICTTGCSCYTVDVTITSRNISNF